MSFKDYFDPNAIDKFDEVQPVIGKLSRRQRLGLALRRYFQRTWHRTWGFGFRLRYVCFADKRSGTEAICLTIDIGARQWQFYPFTWLAIRRESYRTISLREKLAVHHSDEEDDD